MFHYWYTVWRFTFTKAMVGCVMFWFVLFSLYQIIFLLNTCNLELRVHPFLVMPILVSRCLICISDMKHKKLCFINSGKVFWIRLGLRHVNSSTRVYNKITKIAAYDETWETFAKTFKEHFVSSITTKWLILQLESV